VRVGPRRIHPADRAPRHSGGRVPPSARQPEGRARSAAPPRLGPRVSRPRRAVRIFHNTTAEGSSAVIDGSLRRWPRRAWSEGRGRAGRPGFPRPGPPWYGWRASGSALLTWRTDMIADRYTKAVLARGRPPRSGRRAGPGQVRGEPAEGLGEVRQLQQQQPLARGPGSDHAHRRCRGQGAGVPKAEGAHPLAVAACSLPAPPLLAEGTSTTAGVPLAPVAMRGTPRRSPQGSARRTRRRPCRRGRCGSAPGAPPFRVAPPTSSRAGRPG